MKFGAELVFEERDLGLRQRPGVELVEIGLLVEIRPIGSVVVGRLLRRRLLIKETISCNVVVDVEMAEKMPH